MLFGKIWWIKSKYHLNMAQFYCLMGNKERMDKHYHKSLDMLHCYYDLFLKNL